MKSYKAFALLLSYPEADWLAALDEVEQVLREEAAANADAPARLAPLLAMLRGEALIPLQENYVATFDRNPSHSLHLFEHVHGESRERGAAMVNLLQEYESHGLRIGAAELPDYVPLFLEYLSLLPEDAARALLGEAVHVLAHIGEKLSTNASPYADVFAALQALSPVVAEPVPEAPVRDMEQMLETAAPTADGTEPLLVPRPQVAYAAVPELPSRRKGG